MKAPRRKGREWNEEGKGKRRRRRTRARASAREADPPEPIEPTPLPEEAYRLYDLVLKAVGLSPNEPMPTRWMPSTAVIEVARFRGLGLNDDEIVEVARGTRTKFSEPPDGPLALQRQMRNYAAAKAMPHLTPPTPAILPPATGGFHDRQAQRRADAEARTMRIIDAAVRGSTKEIGGSGYGHPVRVLDGQSLRRGARPATRGLANALGGAKINTAGPFTYLALVDTSPTGPINENRDGFNIDAVSVAAVPVPAVGFLL